MTNILLVCSAGMSTSMLVKKMEEAALNHNVEAKIWAVGEARSHDDLLQADIVLLGPQVRYLEKKMNDRVEHSKPVMVIDMAAYGRMDGEKVLLAALDKLKN